MEKTLFTVWLARALLLPDRSPAQASDTNSPARLLAGALTHFRQIFATPANDAPQPPSGGVTCRGGDGAGIGG